MRCLLGIIETVTSRSKVVLMSAGVGAVAGFLVGAVLVELRRTLIFACTAGASTAACYDPFPGSGRGSILVSLLASGGLVLGALVGLLVARSRRGHVPDHVTLS